MSIVAEAASAQERIRQHDEYYVRAASSIAEQTHRVLKHGDTFLVTDRHGDIRPLGFEEHGLFHRGTRFLSRLVFRYQGLSPFLLSSTVKNDNQFLLVDLSNPDYDDENGERLLRGTVHLERLIFLYNGVYYERLMVTNYGQHEVNARLSYEYDADFADIFEVRGVKRAAHGDLRRTVTDEGVNFIYTGRDQVERTARLSFSRGPSSISESEVRFVIPLAPRQSATVELSLNCYVGTEKTAAVSLPQARAQLRTDIRHRQEHFCRIETSNEQFNDWLNRSYADLQMMLSQTEHGLYPYAGIPWYATTFGRDGIITAMETLCVNPGIARGVLQFLAATQAKNIDCTSDAEPGKIVHEMRDGEMANLGEIPFGRYYGSIDATPLFVMLAGRYYQRTADRETIRRLWPNITAALRWLESYGDLDGDGYVEYERKTEQGLINQGWKDSADAVFHADGTLAKGPIALCEVQGYAYEAFVQAANLARALGDDNAAEQWQQKAERLAERFRRDFWDDELHQYVLALDGNKQPCRVRSSNAGHCLFTGIADEHQARQIGHQLTDLTFFSGWGVRTVASSESRYNPMSYHNGSVWPHDNAIIAV
ncbi:MAG: amylo-alpha-1,6-glucosidase, partial [Candidatus Zixiibacteriota bacterium]